MAGLKFKRFENDNLLTSNNFENDKFKGGNINGCFKI